MVKNKLIFKNSLVLYVRLFVVSVIGLLSSKYTIQALGVSGYGLYSVVGSIVFSIAFLSNVMSTTTYRFIAFEEGSGDSNSVNKVFNISLTIHIALAFLVLILSESLGVLFITNYLNVDSNKILDAVFVFRLSVFSAFFSILGIPYQGLLVAKEKFKVFSIIDIFRALLQLSLVFIVLFYSGNKLRLYSLLVTLVSIIPTILYFTYSFRNYYELIRWKFQFDFNKYKEMFYFSGWTFLGAAAVASEIQFSVLLINLFFGTIINAGFSLASSVNNIVKMFSQSLNQSVIPQITKSYSGGDKDRTMELVIFTSKYSFFLILFPSIPILLETDFMLRLWVGEVPNFSSLFTKIFIFNAIIASMNSGIPAVVQATGKIKYFQVILSILSLIGLPISYFLFNLGFPTYTLSIVYLVISVINFFVLQILLKFVLKFDISNLFSKVYLKIIYVTLWVSPLFLIPILFPPSFTRFYFSSSFSIFWLILVIYLFGMEKVEKSSINSFVKNKYNLILTNL